MSNFIAILPNIFIFSIENYISFLILIVLFIISYRTGNLLIRIFKIENDLNYIEKIVYKIVAGFGISAYLIFAAGIAGLLYKIPLTVFFIISFLLCLWKFPINDFYFRLKIRFDTIQLLAMILILIFILLNFIMVFSPEIFYDALVYHLALPKLYLMHHKISPIQYIAHSNFPSTQQMLYLIALIQGNEITAKLLHFCIGLMTVMLLYSTVAKNIGLKYSGMISVLLFYSMPMVSCNSWYSGNDVATSLFFTVTFSAALNLLYRKNYNLFYICAVFSGLTLSLKYTAAFSVAGLLLVLIIFVLKNNRFQIAVNLIFKILLIMFLIISVWLIKNYFFTGNPVYPFFYGIFSSPDLIQLGGGGKILNMTINLFSYDIKKLLLSFWQMSITGEEIGIHFLIFSPFLLVLFVYREKKMILFLAGFILSYLIWFTGTPHYRFIMPVFVILAAVISYCICRIIKYSRMNTVVLIVVLSLSFLMNNLQTLERLKIFPYFKKKISKDDYLSSPKLFYPRYSYKTILWANSHLKKDSRILIVGDGRSYYLERDFISYSLELNKQPLMEYIKKSANDNDLLENLKKDQITHFLVNYPEAMRINSSYKTFYWDSRDRKVFNDFWNKYILLEYYKHGAFLYKIDYAAVQKKKIPLNLLEELQKANWDRTRIFQIFYQNKEFDYMLDEFDFLQTQGVDINSEIQRIKEIKTNKFCL